MRSMNQFYTGGDPAYFPVRGPGRKSALRNLIRAGAGPALTILMVSLPVAVIVVRLLRQVPPPAPPSAGVPAQKHMHASAQLTVTAPEPMTKSVGRRYQQPGVGGGSGQAQAPEPQLASSPLLERIILDQPPLVAPFPTTSNIAPGTPRAHLVQAFGKPDLSAHTVQQRRLMETYVYKQRDQATVILMQDGSVVSAYTGRPPRIVAVPSEPDSDY